MTDEKIEHPGLFIERAMIRMNIDQTEMAKKVGCSKQQMNAILRGRVFLPIKMCRRLAEVLKMKPEDLAKLQTDYEMYRDEE